MKKNMTLVAMTITEMITMATTLLTLITDSMKVFMEPPLVWFVSFAVIGVALGMAKKLIPAKKKGN